MKRKVLCIALALLMCMMVTVPAFADAEKETPPERGAVDISFSLKHNSGLSYGVKGTVNRTTMLRRADTYTSCGRNIEFIPR